MQIIINAYPVDLLTPHYRIYGELRVRGDPSVSLNEPSVDTLTVHDAVMLPLHEGMRLGAVDVETLYVPKAEPQIITLGDFKPMVKPLPRTERLICFTDTYLLRGTFHMAFETQVQDTFSVQGGPFFTATNVDIFSLYPLPVEVKASSTLAYVRGDAVRSFYSYTGKPAGE